MLLKQAGTCAHLVHRQGEGDVVVGIGCAGQCDVFVFIPVDVRLPQAGTTVVTCQSPQPPQTAHGRPRRAHLVVRLDGAGPVQVLVQGDGVLVQDNVVGQDGVPQPKVVRRQALVELLGGRQEPGLLLRLEHHRHSRGSATWAIPRLPSAGREGDRRAARARDERRRGDRGDGRRPRRGTSGDRGRARRVCGAAGGPATATGAGGREEGEELFLGGAGVEGFRRPPARPPEAGSRNPAPAHHHNPLVPVLPRLFSRAWSGRVWAAHASVCEGGQEGGGGGG